VNDPDGANVAPLVLSVMLAFEYETDTSVTFCPDGHEKPRLAALGTAIDSEPTMLPFLTSCDLSRRHYG
jgi:hypothetical protein